MNGTNVTRMTDYRRQASAEELAGRWILRTGPDGGEPELVRVWTVESDLRARAFPVAA